MRFDRQRISRDPGLVIPVKQNEKSRDTNSDKILIDHFVTWYNSLRIENVPMVVGVVDC